MLIYMLLIFHNSKKNHQTGFYHTNSINGTSTEFACFFVEVENVEKVCLTLKKNLKSLI
jgi:hypothetical protein